LTISAGELFFVSLNGAAVGRALVWDELAQVQLQTDLVKALFLAALGTEGFTLFACGWDICRTSVSTLAIFVAQLLAFFLLIVVGNASFTKVNTVLTCGRMIC